MSVTVVHWNPRQPIINRGVLKKLRVGRNRINNFGDVLGPIIVKEVLSARGLRNSEDGPPTRLLTIGSILHLANSGDSVWGSGINGRKIGASFSGMQLDVRSVRGPHTAEVLNDAGIVVPEIYGDPGLLVGKFWSRESYFREELHASVRALPNLFDFESVARTTSEVIDPTLPIDQVLSLIASSDLIIGSSLHGIVVAESWGIPARMQLSSHEPLFKYSDYYAGTGRRDVSYGATYQEALEMGGVEPPIVSLDAILEAFPADLYLSESGAH